MNPVSSSSPVFVLCCARSGSTLLRYVLDAHPELSCPPEMQIGRLCEDLRWTAALALGFEVSAPGPIRASVDESVPPPVLARCRHTIDTIMADYLERTGKTRWCDKSVSTIENLPLLQQVFPDAKFICLYRNCMDVVHSGLEVSRLGYVGYGFSSYIAKRLDNTVAALVDYWCEKVEKIHSFELANPGKVHRLRYEDLVFSPDSVLPPLLEFLGVQPDPDLSRRVFKVRHEHGPGDANAAYSRKIDSKSVGKGSTLSIRQLSAKDLERANGILKQLDYAPIDAGWDSQPSPYVQAGLPKQSISSVATATDSPAAALDKLGSMVGPRDLQGTIKFVFDDRGGEIWCMRIQPDGLFIQEGDAPAECEVRLALSLLRDIADGEANPVTLLRSGDLRISGDMGLVRKVFQT